jgi:RND family efflux transporter MFP subunit
LQSGGPARVIIGSLNSLEVEGHVRAVVPRADDRARTFPVKVSITNSDGRIAVGMLARVFLPVGAPEDAVIVPKDAIVEQGNQTVLFRVGAEGAVERVQVETGSAAGAWVAVDGDLQPGDRIVTRGNERIFPGQSVEAEVMEYELP